MRDFILSIFDSKLHSFLLLSFSRGITVQLVRPRITPVARALTPRPRRRVAPAAAPGDTIRSRPKAHALRAPAVNTKAPRVKLAVRLAPLAFIALQDPRAPRLALLGTIAQVAVPRTRDALEARIVHQDQVRPRRAPQVISVRL